jgi:hypothetical protein
VYVGPRRSRVDPVGSLHRIDPTKSSAAALLVEPVAEPTFESLYYGMRKCLCHKGQACLCAYSMVVPATVPADAGGDEASAQEPRWRGCWATAGTIGASAESPPRLAGPCCVCRLGPPVLGSARAAKALEEAKLAALPSEVLRKHQRPRRRASELLAVPRRSFSCHAKMLLPFGG